MTASIPFSSRLSSTEYCLSLLLKRFLLTAFPLLADTENPRRIRPREFVLYLALNTFPEKCEPLENNFLNCQLRLMLNRQFFFNCYGTKRFLPLRLLALITFLPPLVAIRARKPCLRFLEILLG